MFYRADNWQSKKCPYNNNILATTCVYNYDALITFKDQPGKGNIPAMNGPIPETYSNEFPGQGHGGWSKHPGHGGRSGKPGNGNGGWSGKPGNGPPSKRSAEHGPSGRW